MRQIPKIIAAIVEGLLAGVGQIAKVAAEMFFGITDGAEEAKQKMSEVSDGIKAYADTLEEVSPKIANANNMFSNTGKSMGEIDDEIRETEETISEILKTEFDKQEGYRQEDLVRIQQYQQRLVELENEKLGIYRGVQQAEITKIKLDNEITQEEAAQYVANLEESLEQANQATEAAYTTRLTEIERFHQAAGTVGTLQYESEILNAKNYHDRQLAENQGFYNEGLQLIQEGSKKWVNGYQQLADTTNELMNEWRYEQGSTFDQITGAMGDFVGGFDYLTDDYADVLSYLVNENTRGFMNMAATYRAGGDELDDETKGIISSILNNFEGLPEDFDDVGKEALSGLTYGMEDEIPALADTSEMSAQEIVDAIKEYLDINSPSVVMEEIGRYVSQGLAEGIERGEPYIEVAAQNVAELIYNSFTKEENGMVSVGTRIASKIADGIKSGLSNISTNMTAVVDKITSIIRLQDNTFRQLGIKIIDQINGGLVFKRSALSTTVGEMIASIKAILNSAVVDMFYIGQRMANGLWAGFISQEGTLSYKIRTMMKRLVNTARSEMKINSPSKVWAEIGDYMAQGLGVGFTDEMKTVTRDIQGSLPRSITGANNTGVARAEMENASMVSAFKEALSEMKIELDDNEVGRFVDRTVTQLVYA